MKYRIYQLRIWLAYFIMPKGVRTYLIKALEDEINDLEKDTEELLKQMNAEAYGSDKDNDDYMHTLSEQIAAVTQIPMEEAAERIYETISACNKANIKPIIRTKDLERLYLPSEIKRGIKSKKKRGIK